MYDCLVTADTFFMFHFMCDPLHVAQALTALCHRL